MNKISIFRLCILVSLGFFISCEGTEEGVGVFSSAISQRVTSVSISQTNAELEIGESLHLEAIVSPSDASNDVIIWTSSKPDVASVTNTGTVNAKSKGNTTITAMAGGKTASCYVTVNEKTENTSSISISANKLPLVQGEHATISAYVNSRYSVTCNWSSSDPSIATVSSSTVKNSATITAVKTGTAIITAVANNQKATCEVTVYDKVIPVDLGIVMTRPDGSSYKLLWGDRNLDAGSWGMTSKDGSCSYYWTNYKWCTWHYESPNYICDGVTKYCSTDKSEFWTGNGKPDGKLVLDLEDDIAYVELGGKWRMPTKEEWEALVNHCSFSYNYSKRNGYYISPRNNTDYGEPRIYLPDAPQYAFKPLDGYLSFSYYSSCEYWSSSLDPSDPRQAYSFGWPHNHGTSRGPSNGDAFMHPTRRYIRMGVRPVMEVDL